ncbi:MAG: EamA family transporter [Candidimonas sp.]|nr:MAG: EamA family transporter [Candidimonas sp.]
MAVTVLCWGMSWVVMKSLAPLIGPFDLVAARYAVAFVVLFACLLAARQPLNFPPFWLTVGIALFQTTLFQCLAQYALVTGGAGHVVMLAYTMPFWAVLFAWLLLGERPTRRHVLAFALAASGLLAVLEPWNGVGSLTSSLLAVAGGVCWGLGTVLSKMLFQRHRVNVLTVTAWQMLLGAVLTLPLVVLWPQQPVHWGSTLYLGLLYMGVIASALGWVLWMFVVRRVSATMAGMSSLAVPIFAVALAWLLLDERPDRFELIGIALIVAGLVAVSTTRPGGAKRNTA